MPHSLYCLPESDLAEERITAPANLTVALCYPEDAVVEMRIFCEKTGQAPAISTPGAQAIPLAPLRRVILVTLCGVPSSEHFIADRPHINIGREDEVVDSLGRPIRCNDLFFPEGAHEANASVSRSHAHLGFDAVATDGESMTMEVRSVPASFARVAASKCRRTPHVAFCCVPAMRFHWARSEYVLMFESLCF